MTSLVTFTDCASRSLGASLVVLGDRVRQLEKFRE